MLSPLARLAAASRRRHLLVSLTPIAMLLLVAAVAWSSVRQGRAARAWVDHTQQVRDSLASLRSRLSEAETGARGFHITGDSAYLAPTRGVRDATAAALAVIRRLMRDDAGQQERLDTLAAAVAARFDTLEYGVELTSREGTAAAQRWLADGGGLRLSTRIRGLLDRMAATERQLLAARQAREDRIVSAGWAVMIAAGLAALVAWIALNLALARAVERANDAVVARDMALAEQRELNTALSEQAAELEIAYQQLQEQAVEAESANDELRATTEELVARTHGAEDAEHRLRVSEQRLQMALEGAREGLWDWDIVAGTLYRSPQWYRLLGYARADDAVGSIEDFLAMVHPDDVGDVRATLDAHLDGRSPAFEKEHRMRRGDGSWAWILGRGRVMARDAGGRALRMVGTHADVSARHAMEDALRASEARLAGIVESAMDAIISVDDRHRIVVFNGAAERVLRCSAAEAIGTSFERFVPERLRAAFAADFGPLRGVARGEATVGQRADGLEFPMEATVATHGAGGARLHTIIVRDVSEQHLLEAQLRHAQKMEAIGQFAGGIAHDFNNLLMVISGNLEFVRGELEPGSTIAQDLAEAERGVARATALVKQLLAFSRKQVLQPRVLEVNDVLRDAESLLRRVLREDIVLDVHRGADAGAVRADPGQLEQVLMNLVVNARDAMPSGGAITIETGAQEVGEEERARWSGIAAGPYVRLVVRDTGGGMNADTLAHVFEPFFTTKPVGQGTGLGLATVYGIVTQSGGAVRVESQEDEGTSVTILLPQHAGAARAPVAGDGEAPRGHETILLVEDESALRGTVRRILERNGYGVLEARHGEDALAVWRERRGRPDAPALVLTDVRMPQMGGRELARQLRTEGARVPVLLMSGYADAVPSGGELREEDGAGFLEKPFTSQTLLARVRELLDRGAVAV